jgi:predicted TPR repeat methyltransferase
VRYILPHVVADKFFARFVSEAGEGPVLDVGAGTGLCGARLRALLDGDALALPAEWAASHCSATRHVLIDGVDISRGMLHVAANKMTEPRSGGEWVGMHVQ